MSSDAQGRDVIIKGSIHPEDLAIENIYVAYLRATKYTTQLITNIRNLILSNAIIGGDFNTPLAAIDRSSKQKINKQTGALNDTLDKMGFTDIFRTFHNRAAEYTFFSSAHGIFSSIDHILGKKVNPKEVQRDRGHTVHIFSPQHYETRNQLQETIWKGNKYLETEEHPTKE